MKLELQKALRNCCHGDINSKLYVKEYIKNWLTNVYEIDKKTIDNIIPFGDNEKLSTLDKFDIILYINRSCYGNNAFTKIIEWLEKSKNTLVEKITAEDINELFIYNMRELSFSDKLNIISQRIYQYYKGHGVIDELRDLNIDGVSGGVSGMPSEYIIDEFGFRENSKIKYSYESIWLFYKGRMINLECLSFVNQRELERVCKNIYRYDSPGQLSAAKGYIANEMKDGSRVIVARPPFSESWCFFIRKFGSSRKMKIEELIKDRNSELIIEFIRFIICGCQVTGITGEQGCGKTTLLKAVIGFIPKQFTLRIQELIFELHLRELYPDRNIVSFKETSTVSGREGLDIQKKTDGTVNIIGEVATSAVAGWLVMVSQVASRFTLFTHHAKTTEGLIMSLRNDLMNSAGFRNETIAEEQVRTSVRFDIHMVKRADGYRYIERITEIQSNMEDTRCRDIIVMHNGGYIWKEALSSSTIDEMKAFMNDADREAFTCFCNERSIRYEAS